MEEIKTKLEQVPRFRERKDRDYFLNIMTLRNLGLIDDKPIKADDVITIPVMKLRRYGVVYGSYERYWRQCLEQNPSLRGSDYNTKEELEQEKKMELGYVRKTPARVEAIS